ncbi:hypothetical protein ADK64_39620 [Streptomyces sp. MMG1121]|nr:hypothetical protein ADK64_39620 [Streptomyces sp. MMG1121]
MLVAVLLGLFLMHGGPAAAGGGCHGTMPDTTAMRSTSTVLVADTAAMRSTSTVMVADTAAMRSTSPTTASHTAVMPAASTPVTADGVAIIHPADGKAAAHPTESVRGDLCLATTTRSDIPLPPLTALAFALTAVVLLRWARRAYGEVRRRGPPGGGRDLLLQVCVART